MTFGEMTYWLAAVGEYNDAVEAATRRAAEGR
jgi:hypothetical protein